MYAAFDESLPLEGARPLPFLIFGAHIVLTDTQVEWLEVPSGLKAWSRLARAYVGRQSSFGKEQLQSDGHDCSTPALTQNMDHGVKEHGTSDMVHKASYREQGTGNR